MAEPPSSPASCLVSRHCTFIGIMSRLLRLINAFQYLSIFIGVTALCVDLENRRMRKLKAVKYFIVVGNLMFVVWIPNAVLMNLSHNEQYKATMLARYANYGLISSRLWILMVAIFTRHKRDARLEKWIMELLQLQSDYFDRFSDITRITQHRKWLLFNFTTMWLHVMSIYCWMWNRMLHSDFRTAQDFYLMYGVIAYQHYFMLQHSCLLCYLRECFSVLNQQLHVGGLDPKIGVVYYKLCRLSKELSEIYNPINFWIQLCLVITNSLVGYIAVLSLFWPKTETYLYEYLFGSGLYPLLLIHMYLYFMICEWYVRTASEIDAVLYQFVTKSPNQDIEKICLTRCCNRVNVNIYNIFEMSMSMLFTSLAQTLLNTLLLLHEGIKMKIN